MKKDVLVDSQFIKYAKKICFEFYKNLEKTNFKNISNIKLLELKKMSLNLLEEENITKSKFVNYVKKMKRLINEDKYINYTDEEKYILFMFSVDPTFEAFKIYGETNHIDQTKKKMNSFFGLYDKSLIKIENNFIKNFFSEKEFENINQEIEKRVFK